MNSHTIGSKKRVREEIDLENKDGEKYTKIEMDSKISNNNGEV